MYASVSYVATPTRVLVVIRAAEGAEYLRYRDFAPCCDLGNPLAAVLPTAYAFILNAALAKPVVQRVARVS
jgi:hypothetical protein